MDFDKKINNNVQTHLIGKAHKLFCDDDVRVEKGAKNGNYIIKGISKFSSAAFYILDFDRFNITSNIDTLNIELYDDKQFNTTKKYLSELQQFDIKLLHNNIQLTLLNKDHFLKYKCVIKTFEYLAPLHNHVKCVFIYTPDFLLNSLYWPMFQTEINKLFKNYFPIYLDANGEPHDEIKQQVLNHIACRINNKIMLRCNDNGRF